MGDAWRRRTASSMLPCALASRGAAPSAKLVRCGVFCGRKLSSETSDPGTPSARGMALLRLTPLDGPGCVKLSSRQRLLEHRARTA